MAKRSVKYYKRAHKPYGVMNDLEKSILSSLSRRGMPRLSAAYETEALEYQLTKKYKPDFVVTLPSGRKIYLEVKGYFRYEDQVKMKAVKKSNPDLDIRFVFTYDNMITGTQMRYSDWCDKYNFSYCFGNPPKHWFVD